MLRKLIFIFLFFALITGGISFSGFLVGSTLAMLIGWLFPIFAILFIIALIRHFTKTN